MTSQLRDDVRHCLIVAPGGLVEQWQDKLFFKFGLRFDLLTNQLVDANVNLNVFGPRPEDGGDATTWQSSILRSTLLPGYIADMVKGMTFSRIGEAAQDQWGLITRRQAELVGVPQTTMERLTAPGSVLERVAHGVYRMAGAPEPDHLALRAAWLQLEPGVWVWERTPVQGVVSHRSAAGLYGLGHLPADRHEFILPSRKQTRRPDVRLHQGSLSAREWVRLSGLPVTRPTRIASDLLDDHEDPEGVAQIVADALRGNYDYPGLFADSLAAQASRFGLRRGDGLGVMRWLLDLVGDPGTPRWLDEARADLERESARSSGKRATS